MSNDQLFSNTYQSPIELKSSEESFMGGLCISAKDIDELYLERDTYLHTTEKEYFKKLIYPKRQLSYLLGRFCAKQAIAAYLDQDDATSISIKNGIFQQPIVHHPFEHNLQVSISHSDTLGAALAFSETCPMAIDIETACHNQLVPMLTHMTLAERKLFTSFSGTEIMLITILWTAKEALSKVLKCGFMIPCELLEIATLEEHNRFALSTFKNFYQYEVLSFSLANSICSVVYPRKSELKLNIFKIQEQWTAMHKSGEVPDNH